MSTSGSFAITGVRPSTTCNTQLGTRCRSGEERSVDRGLGEIHPAEEVEPIEVAVAGEEAEVPRILPTPVFPVSQRSMHTASPTARIDPGASIAEKDLSWKCLTPCAIRRPGRFL